MIPRVKRILFLNSLVFKAWINVLTWDSFHRRARLRTHAKQTLPIESSVRRLPTRGVFHPLSVFYKISRHCFRFVPRTDLFGHAFCRSDGHIRSIHCFCFSVRKSGDQSAVFIDSLRKRLNLAAVRAVNRDFLIQC